MKTFIGLFANIYPCWFCAKDFQTYISKEETKPKVKTQEEFGRWLCDAHNEVNVKIGKPKFDCNLWRQRWKDGWEDGRCD
jgi:FAD-linked sulfhydryl oxidase